VGHAVAAELAGDYDVICLRHRQSTDVPGVREISADLTQPGLGLSARDRGIAQAADVIVHCAASTSFHNNRAKMESINIRGTERVLELAAAGGARLMHLSTAFVARHQPELVGQPLTGRGPAAYVESKVGGEDLVRSAGLGALTVRPSVVIGDSTTGRIRQAQGLHRLAGAVMRSEVPLLGIRLSTLVDCVPQDYVARAIRRLIEHGVPSGEVWLTAGQNALTAGEVIETALGVGADAGLRPSRFRVVDPDMVERLLLPMVAAPEFKELRRQFEEMSAMMDLFAAADPFPSTWELADPALRPSHDELLDALDISLRWWAEREGLFATEGAA
jgi:nucleoside-diphosphate-sugar epimerase